MVFLRVNEKDPMAELCTVWCFAPPAKRTGHGENAERKSNEFRRLRHLPKYGHGRGELKEVSYRHSMRTEGRYNFVASPAFVPMFMTYQPPKVKVARVDAVLKQPTLFERYLTMRRR